MENSKENTRSNLFSKTKLIFLGLLATGMVSCNANPPTIPEQIQRSVAEATPDHILPPKVYEQPNHEITIVHQSFDNKAMDTPDAILNRLKDYNTNEAQETSVISFKISEAEKINLENAIANDLSQFAYFIDHTRIYFFEITNNIGNISQGGKINKKYIHFDKMVLTENLSTAFLDKCKQNKHLEIKKPGSKDTLEIYRLTK